MNDPTPHYVLTAAVSQIAGIGHWRFTLRPINGQDPVIEESDTEPFVWGERLGLLTVLRALESLDQPSRVTLVGSSPYVEQGILYGVAEWRENDWRWEYFGQMTPVRDADLWQRMDRVLRFHRVECRQRRLDGPHATIERHHWTPSSRYAALANGLMNNAWVKHCALAVRDWCDACQEAVSLVRQKLIGGSWLGIRAVKIRVRSAECRASGSAISLHSFSPIPNP
ncbi:MAG: hypothetical protein LLF97_03915 [Planctomycetaceae bacterium]|nr:hypothetical protein [Planctomycetaceae bacterium]